MSRHQNNLLPAGFLHQKTEKQLEKQELAVEDNQAGNGKRGSAHLSVYMVPCFDDHFRKKYKRDITNFQHLCTSFIF